MTGSPTVCGDREQDGWSRKVAVYLGVRSGAQQSPAATGGKRDSHLDDGSRKQLAFYARISRMLHARKAESGEFT